ncbi:MAG TPA: peptide ABC transporter substrate-binding protein [Gaiellales bacterium]|nr:peptide ABC transporter substrate-binding protein [Gaiellales bacterium]
MTLRDRTLIAAFAVLFVAASAVALATSGGSAGPTASGQPTVPVARRYVEGVLGHATNASPFGARSTADRELVALLFRGLVKLGPGQSIVGDLASSWDVDPSGNTWTFHLRPGLQWQDGQPLTADDVAFTIRALSDPTYDGPGAESWREVTATASDPVTVALRLTTPLGGFLQAATQPIAPEHILGLEPPAKLSSDAFGLHPIGSGPFELVTLDGNRAVVDAPAPALEAPFTSPTPAAAAASGPITAFPSPYLAGIEFEYFDDAAGLTAAWQRGELDGASGLDPSDAATLGAQPGARLLRYPSSSLLAVVPDLRPGHGTFSDPAVRKALLSALDRNAILADPLLGFGTVADALIPPWAAEFDATASPPPSFDPTAAQAGLTAAGWKRTDAGWVPKGAKAPVQITVLSADAASNPVASATAEDVAQAWHAIGLTVTHESVPAAELLADRIEPGSFDVAVVPLVIGLDPDLYPLLASSQTRSGGANLAGLQDPTLDRLLAAARAPGAADQRLKAYAALQERLASTMPILPLAFRDEVVVLRDTLTGPVIRPVGGPGDRFWDVLTWRLAQAPTSS